MTSFLHTPPAARSSLSDLSDQSESPRLQASRPASSLPQGKVPQLKVPQVQVAIEWTAAARRVEGELNRRKINTAMRRAIRETLATAPPQHGALAKYFETASAPACEVGITISDDAEIAELNAQYRHKPRPTDVLSFAQNEGEDFPFDLATFATDEAADMPPRSLGDLVISWQTTVRQAREQGHSLETEIAFLTVHGTLHLLGFDHVSDAGRRAMWKWQDRIVDALR